MIGDERDEDCGIEEKRWMVRRGMKVKGEEAFWLLGGMSFCIIQKLFTILSRIL